MRIRDKEIFVLFVIGFTFVFILLCSGYASVSNWLWQYKNQAVAYEYLEDFYIHSINSYDANFMDSDVLEEQGYIDVDMERKELCFKLCKNDAADMVSILSNQNNTTYISHIYLEIGEGRKSGSPDIVFSYRDIWYRNLAEGQYPSIKDSSNICAVIGENLISDTVMINGKRYIWVGDMYIEVSGIFENYNASGEDYSIAIFGGDEFFNRSNAFRDKLINTLNDDLLQTFMGSGNALVSKGLLENDIDQNSNLYLGAPGYVLKYSMDRQENKMSRNIWDYLYNIKSMMICVMVLFGIINCIMLSKVWAARRQKDFLIMRIYGLSNKRILLLVLQELSIMAGIGLILAAVISVIYINVTGGWRTSEHMLEWLILILLLGFMLTVSVCIISVYLFVNKLKPAQAVRS